MIFFYFFLDNKNCDDELLHTSYPSSFFVAASKEAWAKDVWDSSDGGC